MVFSTLLIIPDAQPALRLLAQSRKLLVEDYPGLEDVMSLILMDEMNLAHVELYFAEFLSNLSCDAVEKAMMYLFVLK